MTPLKWKLPHKTTVEIVWNIQENVPKQFFSKILPNIGPMTSSWHPKPPFLSILSNFSQISAFLTTLIWKLSHKTMVEFVHSTKEISLKQFSFTKIYPILALWRHLDTQNRTFEHFKQFFADFCLFDHLNIEIIP